MAIPRFFIDQPPVHQACAPGVVLNLAKDTKNYHHITKVLRFAKGNHVEITIRDLWETWLCQIEAIDEQGLQFRCLELLESDQLPFEVTLVLGFSKGDTNEKVVRQATELGVKQVVPVLFERSISRPEPKKAQAKIGRLRKIATSAAQQSHRSDLPQIENLHSFKDLLKFIESTQPDLIAVPWEEEDQKTLWDYIESADLSQTLQAAQLPQPLHLFMIIGPEGGISAEEIDQLQKLGAQSLSLGPTILRVDTAVVASLSIASSALQKKLSKKLHKRKDDGTLPH